MSQPILVESDMPLSGTFGRVLQASPWLMSSSISGKWADPISMS